MKKRVELPFEYNPCSKMYQFIAFPMGIIQGSAKEDITPWLCGKYANCAFEKNEGAYNKFTVYPHDTWCVHENVLLMQHVMLFHKLYHDLFEDEISLMRHMISMGYYVSSHYNEEHVPGKWSYQKKYYPHDFILIGYDDISRTFISAGYLQDGQFQRFIISYEDMGRAINSLRGYKRDLYFWKLNPEFKFELKLNRVIGELSDYLCSTTSMPIYSDNRYWGIEAIQYLIKLFADSCKSNSEIDIRYTRGLMEHKFLMHMRMDYLLKNGFLTDSVYADKAKQVYRMSENVHMLALKYDYTGKRSIGDSIHKDMQDMLAIETAYLPLVLSELQIRGGGKP